MGSDSAENIARAVAAHGMSPVDLVEDALERARRWQPAINAFSHIFADEALDAARRLEDELARGAAAGALNGVPVAVKDLFDVAGHETTGCSRAFAGRVAAADAALVARLRAAGALVVGKTNQDELGCGSTNLNSACGPVANPWDRSRIAGGSSGGSAAAIAAGVVPLALGSDTGGSIRVPAAFCGVVGLKPTTGRLPTAGAMPLAPSLDCPGLMARSVRDLQLLWRAVARADTGGGPAPARRVGLLDCGPWTATHPAVAAATARAAGALESAGLSVTVVPVDSVADAPDVWNRVAWPEFAAGYAALQDRGDVLAARTRRLLGFGASLAPPQRAAARRRREEITSWFLTRLRQLDVLLAPSVPYPPPRAASTTVPLGPDGGVDVHDGGPSLLARPFNLAGLPVVALPAGLTESGLPVGVQLIGGPDQDDHLLSLARQLEAVLPHPPAGSRALQHTLGEERGLHTLVDTHRPQRRAGEAHGEEGGQPAQ